MKREKILKTILTIMMGLILVAMATNVYALSDDDYLDITNTVDTNTTNTDSETVTDLNTDTSTDLNTNTEVDANVNYNTDLPEAGLAENTMLGIAVTILSIIAVVAYNKVKYYKNI